MKDSQHVFKELGDYGCYFLGLIEADKLTAQQIVDYYETCTRLGYVADECFVMNPVAVWNLVHPSDPVGSVVKSYEFRKGYRAVFAVLDNIHFVRLDDNGSILFNPLSTFSENGRRITSYRLLF